MSRHRYRHGMHWIRDEKRLALYMRDNFSCLYCGVGIESEGVILTLDHVKHNGGNHESNLVTCCFDCNRAKSWKCLKTFLKRFTVREVGRIVLRMERAKGLRVKDFLSEAKETIKRRKSNEPF